jgi:putative ATP-dependent endonuclease of the OLD family
MHIQKVYIENYKVFNGKFEITLNPDINILVGNNEAGKSTILEAIHLALTGILNGRYLRNELSQYLFNNQVEEEYLNSINNPALTPLEPPHILIEVYFDTEAHPLFEGNGNSDRSKACGLLLKIEFDEEYQTEYDELVKSEEVQSIPIEYYKVSWTSFARDSITSRSIPMRSALIDTSGHKYRNGSDIYISRIIRNELEDKEKVAVSQAYRRLKERFAKDESIQIINDKVNAVASLSDDKEVSVSVDLATKDAWEAGLTTFLDLVPFQNIGKGEQAIVKTKLALGAKESQKAGVILIEEPENHLSHTKMNEFIKSISENCENKQIIISTHSSFVANKLGLDHLILLDNQKTTRLSDLPPDTQDFFRKLPGYQTLRLLLCKKAILVEGDSDELIVQRAYMDAHDGRLPIEDGIDVISVKLTFNRFLQIAKLLEKTVAVVTDNDGDFEKNITKKYAGYVDSESIEIFADDNEELRTLEPQFTSANNEQLEKLCEVIGIDFEAYSTQEAISEYMKKNKTAWALNVFNSEESLIYPDYINQVIDWCDE